MANGFALETAWVRRRNKRQGYYAYLVKEDADATAVTVWQAFLFPAVGGAGDMVGTAAITFTPSATLSGAGALAGTSALAFTPSATLAGRGDVTGTASFVFTPTGTLGATAALVGTSALVLTPTGTLAGQGALIGIASLTFALAGTADTPTEVTLIDGTTSFGFTLSGTARNFQYLHPIIITTTASIVNLDPSIPATITPIPIPPAQILPLA